jgi:HSP20 family protein
MTLVKWTRGNKNNGNNSTLLNQNTPLFNSEFGSLVPTIWNRLTRPFFSNDFMQEFYDDTASLGIGSLGTTLPAVNIEETENELILSMAAPGMKKSNFKIEMDNDQLRISYNKESEHINEDSKLWRREYNFESFDRYFTLPSLVEQDKIEAKYQDGILRIILLKKEEARKKPVRTIEIK